MSKNDDKIKVLMKVVNDKREKLGDKPKTAWTTNGIFKFDASRHLNLNTVHNPNVLVEALSHVLTKNSATAEAAKILGVKNPVIEFDGYSVADWTADFTLRISQIKWDSEKTKLNDLEKQLKNLISEDAKTEMALEMITDALKIN